VHSRSIHQAETVERVATGAPVKAGTRPESPRALLFEVGAALPALGQSQSARSRRLYSYGLMISSDLLCICAGFAFGSLVRFGDLHDHAWTNISCAALPLFLISAVQNRSYSLESLKSATTAICRVFTALSTTLAILFFFSYFLKAEQEVSRLSVAVGVIATFIMLAAARVTLLYWVRRSFQGVLTSVIMLRDGAFAEPVPGTVCIEAAQVGLRPEPCDPVMIQRLVQLVAGADRVVVVCARELSAAWATMLKGANVCGEILASEAQSVGAVAVGSIGGRSTLVVSNGPLTTQQRATKRLFDLALTIPTLILLAPLLLLLAIAVRLDSPGPVLFRQPRVGLGNRLFTVYKFRTMRAGAADRAGTVSTARDDPRLTRLGKLMRQASLDELPQLLNVLTGTMSLVGPRPHAVGSVAGDQLFWDVDERYAHRHLLKPGITGLAQVRGQRGTTYRVDDLSQRLQSDLEYMSNWSVWTDVKIIGRTFGVVLHPNAY
jgi:polysaccharide biosynthesis protein PslA